MIIVVEGTRSYNNYEIFMRGMGVALSNLNKESSEIQVWSLGPHKINSFTAAFCNSSENFLKQKGYKISFSKVYSEWVESNFEYIDYYAFFANPNEKISYLASKAKTKERIELAIFKY